MIRGDRLETSSLRSEGTRRSAVIYAVLSPEEVLHFLAHVPGLKHRAMLTTCYAAGLRISEVLHLRPTDIDSRRMVIRVEQGVGRIAT